MNNKPPLDFGKVEVLRKHMKLTVDQLCQLIGVSRVSYYGWCKGKTMRQTNDYKVRKTLKLLLNVVKEHDWPTPEHKDLDTEERFELLQKLVEDTK